MDTPTEPFDRCWDHCELFRLHCTEENGHKGRHRAWQNGIKLEWMGDEAHSQTA